MLFLKSVATLFVFLIMALFITINGCGDDNCTKGDCENGEGTYTYPSSSIYEGNFRDGKANGKGSLTPA